MAEQRIILSDGSALIVDSNLPEEQKRVLAQGAEDQLRSSPDLSADPSETDPAGVYTDKMVKSAARGGGGGLATAGDLLSNTFFVAPRIGYNLYQGKPWNEGFGFEGIGARKAYEENVIPQPRGSDYETTAKVAETVAPMAVETLLTGSPKTAPLRLLRDTATTTIGGEAGEFIGDKIGDTPGEYGDLGRTIGAAISPAALSRTGVRALSSLTPAGWAARGLRWLGGPDLFKLIPKTTGPEALGAAAGGVVSNAARDYGGDAAEEERRRRRDEEYLLRQGRSK